MERGISVHTAIAMIHGDEASRQSNAREAWDFTTAGAKRSDQLVALSRQAQS